MESFSKFIRERIAIEEAYAKSLAKLSTMCTYYTSGWGSTAAHSLPCVRHAAVGATEFGTLAAAFEYVRGDVANTAEQVGPVDMICTLAGLKARGPLFVYATH